MILDTSPVGKVAQIGVANFRVLILLEHVIGCLGELGVAGLVDTCCVDLGIGGFVILL